MAKVPILLFEKKTAAPGSAPLVIAQSGSMARCAAKLAGIYPEDPAESFKFETAMQRLLLTDAAVEARRESSPPRPLQPAPP